MLSTEFKSIEDLVRAFPDEESCIVYLEKLRWNGFTESPFDPISKVYECKNNRYRCRNTGKYFNVKTGTIFYNSKIELQKWFMAIWIISTAKKPITSTALAQELGMTQKSAWYMIQRIKNHLGIIPKLPEKVKSTALKVPKAKAIAEIEVVVEKDKLKMLEWLQLLKK